MRSVVVTGAGAGIGRAIAERLVADGWAVVAIERDAELAPTLDGLVAATVVGDVADRDALADAVRVAERLAPLTGWVNNAGATSQGSLHEPDPQQVARLFAVNVEGTYWACSAAVRAFAAAARPGAIVNISSIHGRMGAVAHAAYDTSKGAIEALTRHVATAYGPYGIRANAIAPGAIRSAQLDASMSDPVTGPARRAALERKAPLRRIGEAAEIASVTAFLLSDEASFLTGQSIAVDGGWTTALVPPTLDPELAARYGLEPEPEA
ncbi:MAG TPA: SDR family oxidoreductase [Conexibacter sp.]|nr:SDR family oxidoreductase [Conexibacter sp.]